jgi:type IV pilus assembly protein PilA
MGDSATKPGESWWRPKFTWTSLFALLALAGIVAAVLIPSYGDYANRSQAAEAVSLLGGAKTPLAEYFSDHGKWPKSLEEVTKATSGKYTRSVVITKGAGGSAAIELAATMRTERVDRRVAGHSILYSSGDGGKTWTCRPGTMPEKNLPGPCRTN